MNSEMKELAEKRKGVSERLKALSQERKQIEIDMVPHILMMFSALHERTTLNDTVKKLKKQRGKDTGKGGDQLKKLMAEFKQLDFKWSSGVIAYKKEKQTMKRLGELDKTIKRLKAENPGHEVHTDIIEMSKKASAAHERLQGAMTQMFLLTDIADGNTLKRERLGHYYETMSKTLDEMFKDKKANTTPGSVSIGDFLDTDTFMERLQSGETLSLMDIMSMTSRSDL